MTAPLTVPVFNCVVNVGLPGPDGVVEATVANVAGLVGRGKSEREALAQVVPLFKALVAKQHTAGQPIAWIDPPLAPAAGQSQRLIAVHL
jgi:hypothetical protein